ncbi:hypothetical protein ACP4OV_008201 [Aristida adscensionis]
MAATVERSHVHLCFIDPRDETCALHHVDVAALFHSEPDPDPGAMEVGALELPSHAARFQRPPDPLHTTMGFHLLGRDKVVAVDGLRRTLIYAAANGAVRAGPMLRVAKRHAVSASVGGGLYLLDHIPRREERRCFEALLHAPLREDWCWHRLPQPPYVREPGYTPSAVVAHAVAGDAIWTSTKGGVGTYSFDTRRRAWKKEGGWALPFHGKAEHVPQCGLWFGIASSADRRLCAADLAGAGADAAPEVRGAWEDFRPPKEWFWRNSAVVHLGSGKLCTVRFFGTDPTDVVWRNRSPVVVLTGVEVEPQEDGGIRMVRHRSSCIKLPEHYRHLNWIL